MNHIEDMRTALEAAPFDALLLLSPVNRRYATGFPASDGAVLLTRKSCRYYTDSRYIEAAQAALAGVADPVLTGPGRRQTELVIDVLKDENIETVGVEEEYLSYADYCRLEAKLPAKMVPAQAFMSRLRASKGPQERDALIAAQRLAETAYNEVLELLRPGLTEREVAAELVYRMLRLGAEGVSFDPIVLAGPRGSLPHGVPSDNVLRTGDFVTMDFGCILDGWCSDTTRTVALGHVTDEMRTVYETVLTAQKTGIAAARAGVSGRDVDGAARAVIEKAGYGEYFGHSFGHGVGLEVHEAPYVSTMAETPLPLGSVISAEPGIYLPGRFGVRIEDVLWLTENEAVDITCLNRELIIL